VAPRITAITSLSLEHTAFLGSTLTAIAREKAGIIKPGVPVVCAPQPPEAMAQIQRIAADRGAPVLLADGADPVPDGAFVELADGGVGQRLRLAWDDGTLETLLPLLGSHQAVNCAVARTVLANLARRRLALVTRTALDAGLRGVRWPGRVQVLERAPWLVLDGAHTPDSAARLNETLALFPHRRRWLVVGVARDKDLEGFLAELAPSAAGLALTSVPDHPRMAPADTLAPVASRYAARVAVTPDPAAALGLARTWAAPDDLIVVTGSLFLVGEVLTMLQGPAA
jgi:dihydrofolate synthase/folylpolyglutamate synthase